MAKRRRLLFAHRYGDAACTRRPVRAPQKDRALMLTLSPQQTVNQFLRPFARDGLLALRCGDVGIVDEVGLVRNAQ